MSPTELDATLDTPDVETILKHAIEDRKIIEDASKPDPPDGHIDKVRLSGVWCALVTQPLSPKDPRSRALRLRRRSALNSRHCANTALGMKKTSWKWKTPRDFIQMPISPSSSRS